MRLILVCESRAGGVSQHARRDCDRFRCRAGVAAGYTSGEITVRAFLISNVSSAGDELQWMATVQLITAIRKTDKERKRLPGGRKGGNGPERLVHVRDVVCVPSFICKLNSSVSTKELCHQIMANTVILNSTMCFTEDLTEEICLMGQLTSQSFIK